MPGRPCSNMISSYVCGEDFKTQTKRKCSVLKMWRYLPCKNCIPFFKEKDLPKLNQNYVSSKSLWLLIYFHRVPISNVLGEVNKVSCEL